MLAADDLGLSGRVIDGRFRVEKFIGRGDLSVVYNGTDVLDGSPVAIKCLAPPPGMDPSLLAMFLETFKAGSEAHRKLAEGCPHIAPIFEIGSTFAAKISAEVPYLVREWFDGTSLGHELLLRRSEEKTGRSLRAAIQLLDPVAEALAFAHAQDLVHERVNPQNFFVTSGKGVKVLDFGTARALYPTARDGEGSGLLAISAALLAYAAPEQIDAALGPIGPPTDVYGLALLVLEVLRDRPALSVASGSDIVPRILDPNARPTPKALGITIGSETEAVLARAVKLEPSGRQRTAREFWEALKESAVATETLPRMAPAAPPAKASGPSSARGRPAQRPPPQPEEVEPDSMEGEPVRKAVGPLLPPTPTPFTQEASKIIVAPEPPPKPAPPVSRRAPTIRVPRAPAPTVVVARLQALPPSPPAVSVWRYVIAVVGTAAVVVSGAVGVSRLVAWRAETNLAQTPDVAPVVTTSTEAGAVPAPDPDAAQEPKPFDREAARLALEALAPTLLDCKLSRNHPPHVKITFTPDGAASVAAVSPPPNTTQGTCVAGHYGTARVAPFKGPAVTLTYPFGAPGH